MKRKKDIRIIKAEFAVIGPATEKALLSRGIVPIIKADEFVAEGLAEKLTAVVKPGDRVLIPTSTDGRQVLVKELANIGALVDQAYIYEPVLGETYGPNSLDKVDVILYTSPSIVKNMIQLVGLEGLRGKKAVAIGPVTAKELNDNKLSCITCDEYSTDGIIKKLLEIYKNRR